MQRMHRIQHGDFSHFPALLYGGDYNPEQWMLEDENGENPIWQEDLHLMRKAGVNLVNLGIFSWSSLQPAEEIFTFEWLDRILDLLAEHQIFVALGTGTAAQPAWLSEAYPDVLPVNETGLRQTHGRRLNYCPTNLQFRRLTRTLVHTLAQRYGDHPALLFWHVSNEYGPSCFCTNCAIQFRLWLQRQYGSLEELNQHWITSFWSHTYTSWEQIQPPTALGENSIQGLYLDYRRFMSDANLACYQGEAAILRELTSHIPIFTNLHGLQKSLDYFSWAPHQDIIAWDSYPRHNTHPSTTAFYFDLMRGLGQGKPWLLLEQAPSHVQWHPENPLKRPGIMRLQTYQAIAHGSNSALFFQWRQARSGEEMYHSAIISHAGHERTRVFREIVDLGAELQALDNDLLQTAPQARIALLMSWPNWWAVEDQHTPGTTIDYLVELQRYYHALWQSNCTVDIVSPETDLTPYTLVLAPLLTLISKEQGEDIERYVEQGGTFVTTYFSGMVDEYYRAWLGGFPGPLRRTLGIWVEEFDPLPVGKTNTLLSSHAQQDWDGTYICDHWCDIVHLEGAQALSIFGDDFYAGSPAITENHLGLGSAFYIATRPEDACITALMSKIQTQLGLIAPLQVPQGVEVIQRQHAQTVYTFILNHSSIAQRIALPQPMCDVLTQQSHEQDIVLQATGCAILRPLPQNTIQNEERFSQ
jgi:beta-galactosidase